MRRYGRVAVLATVLLLLFPATGLVASVASADPRSQYGKEGDPPSDAPDAASPTPTPSASPTPSPSPTAASPSPSQTPTGGAATPSPSPSVSPSPTPSPTVPAAVSVEPTSDRLLAEVGDRVRYSIKVTNTGAHRLDEPVVIDLVPREIRIFAVDLLTPQEVKAVQYGESRGKQDIVWVLAPLESRESVTLTWVGTVKDSGDLVAENTVRAKADGVAPVREEHSTYLGTVSGTRITNPRVKPVTRQVVTEVHSRAVAVNASPATLPFTGSDPERAVVLALGLIVAGLGLLWVTQGGAEWRRRVLAAVVAVAVTTMTACVSNDQSTRQQENATAKKQQRLPTNVKGKRVSRKNNKGNGGGTTTNAAPPVAPGHQPPGVTPEDAPPAADQTLSGERRTVRRVRVVTVTAADLPTDTLQSRAGDNVVTYEWDEAQSQIKSAASSLTVVSGAPVEILTELSARRGAIGVRIVLRNLSTERRLAVNGRIVLDVLAADGPIAQLQSGPINEVLNPRGETTATFTYLLPTGSYRVRSAFTKQAAAG